MEATEIKTFTRELGYTKKRWRRFWRLIRRNQEYIKYAVLKEDIVRNSSLARILRERGYLKSNIISSVTIKEPITALDIPKISGLLIIPGDHNVR